VGSDLLWRYVSLALEPMSRLPPKRELRASGLSSIRCSPHSSTALQPTRSFLERSIPPRRRLRRLEERPSPLSSIFVKQIKWKKSALSQLSAR
jgi:hypothetical protein